VRSSSRASLRRARERAEPGDGERSILVDERDDVGDRRERHEVEMTARNLRVDAEEGLSELVYDSGAAELGKWVLGRASGDDGTVGQRLGRPVMVRDDDVEAAFLRLGHLGDGCDPAVDGEDEPAALVGEPGERLAADPITLVEATRQMPGDLCAELAQEEDRERSGGDAVDVVVAVDADPAALLDGRTDLRAGGLHVAEQERVVRRLFPVEETARDGGIGVAAPDEHGGRQLGDPELVNEL
jgi:hypothetical protein